MTTNDLTRMGIGKRFWESTLSQIPEGLDHKARVHQYARNLHEMFRMGSGLLLYGPNGSGKTSIAVAILKEARRWRKAAFSVTAVELRDGNYDKVEFEEGVTIKERALGVPILLIDDLGKERGKSNHSSRVLEDLVRRRSNDLKVTLLTTNITPTKTENFKTVFSRVYSRSFFELLRGCMVPVYVRGHDWRKGEQRAQTVAMDGGGAT